MKILKGDGPKCLIFNFHGRAYPISEIQPKISHEYDVLSLAICDTQFRLAYSVPNMAFHVPFLVSKPAQKPSRLCSRMEVS